MFIFMCDLLCDSSQVPYRLVSRLSIAAIVGDFDSFGRERFATSFFHSLIAHSLASLAHLTLAHNSSQPTQFSPHTCSQFFTAHTNVLSLGTRRHPLRWRVDTRVRTHRHLLVQDQRHREQEGRTRRRSVYAHFRQLTRVRLLPRHGGWPVHSHALHVRRGHHWALLPDSLLRRRRCAVRAGGPGSSPQGQRFFLCVLCVMCTLNCASCVLWTVCTVHTACTMCPLCTVLYVLCVPFVLCVFSECVLCVL
jgi:hypothetical protein